MGFVQKNLLSVSQQDFLSSSYDNALFLHTIDASTIYLLVYVDDIIIIGDDISGIRDLQNFLGYNCKMKDLKHLKYFLALNILQVWVVIIVHKPYILLIYSPKLS